MKGIIWYQENKEQAIKLLERIVDEYKYWNNTGVLRRIISKIEYTVSFNNGNLWRVRQAAIESPRGIACNISYISTSISQNIVDSVIKPCTKAFPYQGISYWNEEPVAASVVEKETVTETKE